MQRKDGTLVDRREMLRIKLKSLATEAKYIRREEDKLRPRGSLTCELREHRTGIVRQEARATSLAYGYIKGYKRVQIENNWREIPKRIDDELQKKVAAMVKRYGPSLNPVPIAQWWSERL